MAFVEGVANSPADLLAAFETAMLANGWTKSGAVMHAGGCFVALAVSGATLTVLGGAGLVGGNALQSPGPGVGRVGSAGTIMQMTFPAAYHIALHSVPREVYLHVNYNVDRWQWLAFGGPGVIVPGSGCWYGASFGGRVPSRLAIAPYGSPAGGGSNYTISAGLFHSSTASDGVDSGCYVNSGVDGLEWAGPKFNLSTILDGSAQISQATRYLFDRSPSELNGAAVLLPCAVWQGRSGNTVSLVAEFAHSRVLRIDNFAPGQVISYGSDRWRVYPFFRKNEHERNGGTFADATAHTGTMGMAVRYDGP